MPKKRKSESRKSKHKLNNNFKQQKIQAYLNSPQKLTKQYKAQSNMKENEPPVPDSSDLKKEKNNQSGASKSSGKNSLKRYPSDSFAQYGVNTPSVEEIVEYQRQYDKLKECIKTFDSIKNDDEEPVSFNVEELEKQKKVLDCKHLTNDQLQVSLDENYKYLYDIYHGFSKSERHQRFHKQNCSNNSKFNDLKYNTSMITFSYEQKQFLLAYLFDKFDNSEYRSNTQYFFKVLLPELCTKIFMDIHNMTYQEATLYLSTRPVD